MDAAPGQSRSNAASLEGDSVASPSVLPYCCAETERMIRPIHDNDLPFLSEMAYEAMVAYSSPDVQAMSMQALLSLPSVRD